MKYLVMLLLFLLPGLWIVQVAQSQEREGECNGFFRWDVKTLTDGSGIKLLSMTPVETDLKTLVSVHPPMRLSVLSGKDGRLPRFTDESRVVKLVVLISKVKVQKDKDLHILLQSPDSDELMIGEIPDPDCSLFDLFPELRTIYRQAREQLQVVTGRIRGTGSPVLVEITGIPFWDARHWWLRGCARNGREIHPILSVKVLSGE